jgi:hypothetical protein
MCKIKFFIEKYLDENNMSKLIERYNELDSRLRWTSGDSIFRFDGILSKKYKFCTFKKKIIRYSWEKTDIEKEEIVNEHKLISFPEKSGTSVHYIKFYGLKETEDIKDEGIRKDIWNIITKMKCINCFTNNDIQCDHKNDLKNDIRVLKKETQKIEDFQPLCRHCNMKKKSIKQKMLNLKKRISAKEFGYNIDFTIGTELLDLNDPNWYKGTYWGDIESFKYALCVR